MLTIVKQARWPSGPFHTSSTPPVFQVTIFEDHTDSSRSNDDAGVGISPEESEPPKETREGEQEQKEAKKKKKRKVKKKKKKKKKNASGGGGGSISREFAYLKAEFGGPIPASLLSPPQISRRRLDEGVGVAHPMVLGEPLEGCEPLANAKGMYVGECMCSGVFSVFLCIGVD